MSNYKKLLLERIIQNAKNVNRISDLTKNHAVVKHLIPQLVRSGSASCLIYSEALSAESFKDLIHKLSLVEKELRETKTNLELILSLSLTPTVMNNVLNVFKETDELIAIMNTSLYTLRKQKRNKPGK